MPPPGETASCRVVIRAPGWTRRSRPDRQDGHAHPHDLTERGVVWRGRGCGFPIMRKATKNPLIRKFPNRLWPLIARSRKPARMTDFSPLRILIANICLNGRTGTRKTPRARLLSLYRNMVTAPLYMHAILDQSLTRSVRGASRSPMTSGRSRGR